MTCDSVRAGLSQPRGRAPALRFDRVEHAADHGFFLGLGETGDEQGIGDPVGHPFPAELGARLDDLRIEVACFGIEGRRGGDVVLFEDIHEPPDADPGAVVAPGVVEHIRLHPGRHRGHRDGRLVVVEVFDVGRHPHRNPGAVRQRQRRSCRDCRVGEPSVFHHLGHVFPWRTCVLRRIRL